ncbi:MAG TPA: triose-phosphate isomerase [bacterium]|jgi:triosephosphate isomerase|nr:triose-phosphate isomerase [bacterium]
MRETIVAGNWKMNTTIADAMAIVGGVLRRNDEFGRVKVIFLPPSIWLVPIKERYRSATLGAQNIYSHLRGPYTGELSVEMLHAIAKYVLVGHSERRTVFGEDHALINAKLKTVLQANLRPILAVGEEAKLNIGKKEKRDILALVKKSELGRSLVSATRGLSHSQWSKMVLAYEPVWAIGSGQAASGNYANSIIGALRAMVVQLANDKVATNIPILYGGSVSRYTAPDFAQFENIDGVLVGNASLRVAEFSNIIETFALARARRKNENSA